MNFGQSLLEALESLNANKLRSSLTMLGIVIGVGAVIAMLSIGAGAQSSITGSIQDIGSNLIFVSSQRSDAVRNPKPITFEDAQAIADPLQAPSVNQVAPTIQGSVEITFGRESEITSVTGITANYLLVNNETLYEGDFITAEQNYERASVVILGPTTAENLFGYLDGVVGQTIRLDGQPFRVIGILDSKGGGSFGNQDDRALVPLSTAQMRLIHRSPNNKVDSLTIQAVNAESVINATEEITQILQTRHRTAVGADDFSIFTQEAILGIAKTITGVFTVFLGGVAAISLLVGGIGIMNIMLVSVTERTREIGLRKALGGRKRDITIQFLTESSLLSLFGGLIGIFLGWLISFIVGKIAAASGTPFTPVVGLDSILLATLFSTAVGLFFGIYPATRAANLEPVEALRSE
jgi:putative ABC transport system permease protein